MRNICLRLLQRCFVCISETGLKLQYIGYVQKLENVMGWPLQKLLGKGDVVYYFLRSSCDVKLFSDDTCLLIHSKNSSSLEININEALTNIQEWTSANKLTVNRKKSSVLIIPPKKTNPIPKQHIKFDDTPIPIQEHVKYILIDSRLTFVHHIQYLETKICRSIGITYKLKNILLIKSLSTLYNLHWCIHTYYTAFRSGRSLMPLI